MNESEIKAVWDQFDTAEKIVAELNDLNHQCWGVCCFPPAACSYCKIAELKAILEAKQKGCIDGQSQ